MPYVDQDIRNELVDDGRPAVSPGELNFLITRLCSAYINRRGLSYTSLNEAVGAMECAKLELYRRMAIPYEDLKIKENGDVY